MKHTTPSTIPASLRRVRFLLAFLVLPCLATTQRVTAATVTIDPATESQTIVGFGATTEGYDASLFEFLINDLGCSLMRLHGGPDDQSYGDLSYALISASASSMQKLKELADAQGYQISFIFSTWTPPQDMKDFSDPSKDAASCMTPGYCGGGLAPSDYTAFAEYMRDYYTACETQSGAQIYAVNFANEPSFANPFYSCVFSPTEYANMLKVFAPIVKQAMPHVLTMGSGDVMEVCNLSVERAISEDPEAAASLDIMAVHHYVGNSPQSTESDRTDVRNWRMANGYATTLLGGKPVLMSESSGYTDAWLGSKGGFELSYGIFNALYYGKAVGWTNYGAWALRDLLAERAAIKHFSRYVRPGSVALGTTSDDHNVLALGFRDPANDKLVLVMLNVGSSSASVSLSMPGAPATFDAYRSSTSEDFASVGQMSASAITLPGQSTTTLVGDYVTAVIPPALRTGTRATPNLGPGPVALYTLDGTRVLTVTLRDGADTSALRRAVHGRCAPGRYVVRCAGGTGFVDVSATARH